MSEIKLEIHRSKGLLKPLVRSIFLLALFVIFIVVDKSTAQSKQNTKGGLLHKSAGNLVSSKAISNGLELTTDFSMSKVVVYSPTSFRITHFLPGEADEEFTFAVSGKPENTKYKIEDVQDMVKIITDSVVMEIQKKPLRYILKNKMGVVLNQDEPAFGTGWIGEQVTTYKKLQEGERFIGLGEKTGPLDRRGEGYINWNTDNFAYATNADPIYASIPFYIGVHSKVVYGLYLNNSYRSHFNFGASNDRFSSFMVEGGVMDYFLFGDATVAGVIQSYSKITGTLTLPPLWSLGYQQCRYSYYPDSEVIAVAKTFREKKIPADVIYLDIHYMDAYKIFTWHPERFPKPKEMLKELNSLGFHTTIIVDPGIKVEKGYSSYEEGLKKNVFLKYPDNTNYTGQVWPGWCHFPDFTQPEARKWWGQSFEGYVNDGVDGFWNDMNEPATWGQRFPDQVIFDFEGDKASHRKGHNLYGFQMARSTYEGTRELLKGKRPFILTRAAFSGIQRYSAVWTGDNVPNDDHMLTGVRLVNSLGLSGVPYAGYDVGGFAGDASRDLFARWITIGALSPFFRGHTMIDSKDSEPWSYGEKTEEISRNYIQFRYNLMPYLYSAFYEASQTGMPVARSLAIDYTHDAKIYEHEFHNQYLFGPSLMVVPVNSTDKFKKTYLPAGKWYDLHSDKMYEGGQSYILETNVENLPLFVKAGGMLVMQSPVQYTAQKPTDTLTIHLYTGGNQSTVYYEDNGDGYEYEKGEFYTRSLKYDHSKNELTLGEKSGSFVSKFKHLRVVFHGSINASKGFKLNNQVVKQETYRHAYMQPLSKFDPIGSAGQDLTKPYPSVVVPLSDGGMRLQW